LKKHTILFTGHMIDARDRKIPRFPADKEKAARVAIKRDLKKEKENHHNDRLIGIAGGASGGDILFHELCLELNIPSEIYLALPKEEYKEKSVSFAKQKWEERFEHLTTNLPVYIFPVGNGDNDSIWKQTNLWMLDEALKGGGVNMTLIALWDGKGGDGEGGTEHMVRAAKESGAKTLIIDIKNL
jgi:hypothetical protein